MLPYIVGVAVVVGIGYILDEDIESTKKKKSKKLAKKRTHYEKKLSKQYDYNQNKKRSILFKQIKYEQSKLKEERRELAKIRNSLQRGSSEHKNVLRQIALLTQKIDQKQQDADRVRG